MNRSHSDITLEIDLTAIKHNYELLSRLASKSVTAAVVKANAYGLGIDKVAPALYSAGCRNFFVATLDEALELSRILGFDCNIYVFHGIKRGEESLFDSNGLIPVLNDYNQLEIWSHKARDEGLKLPAIIHFDTGMNRLGFNWQEAENVSKHIDLSHIEIRYLMSHLACISDHGHCSNTDQLSRSNEVRKFFPGIPFSLANSRGIIAGKDYHFDMVRPGCSLYGVKGSAKEVQLKHVITSKARIIQLRTVEEDGFVGYGATKAVRKGTRLAVVPIGYADGYLRCLSNHSHAYFKGFEVNLVGRVSMDMCIFDITNIPESEIKVGNELEMIGEDYTVDDIADNADTIGYEILTNLGHRYKRIYKT